MIAKLCHCAPAFVFELLHVCKSCTLSWQEIVEEAWMYVHESALPACSVMMVHSVFDGLLNAVTHS